MVRVDGIPEDYKYYSYVALTIMIGGIIVFIISLVIMDIALVSASLIAVFGGFIIMAVMGVIFIRKKKKREEPKITTTSRIILLTSLAASILFTINTYFMMSLPDINTTAVGVFSLTGLAGLVIIQILVHLFLERKNDIKETQEKPAK